MVDSFGTSEYTNEQLADAVCKTFDLRPAAIIEALKLKEVKYLPLAAYGHMGREELNVEWEKQIRLMRSGLNLRMREAG